MLMGSWPLSGARAVFESSRSAGYVCVGRLMSARFHQTILENRDAQAG